MKQSFGKRFGPRLALGAAALGWELLRSRRPRGSSNNSGDQSNGLMSRNRVRKVRRRVRRTRTRSSRRYGSSRASFRGAAVRGSNTNNDLALPAKRRRIAPIADLQFRPAGRRDASAGEMNSYNFRAGFPKMLTLSKLQRISMHTAVFRYQGVSRYATLSNAGWDPNNALGTAGIGTTLGDSSGNAGVPGRFLLRNAVASDTVSATVASDVYPLHVVQLTTIPNLTTNPPIHTEMQSRRPSVSQMDTIFEECMSGQDPNGANAFGWQWEHASAKLSTDINTGTLNGTVGAQYVKHEWFDIRFMLYGQRQVTTMYDIMIVRFDEEELIPLSRNADGRVFADVQKRNAFWHGLVKNISYNPILPASANAMTGMQVLDRRRIVLKPSVTTEADRTPDHAYVKMFYRDGVIRNYNDAPRATGVPTQVDGAAFTQTMRGADLSDNSSPRSALFMIIRATNTRQVTTTSQTANATTDGDMDFTPSYDMVIRKKVRYQPALV